jgi:hypothetical protein
MDENLTRKHKLIDEITSKTWFANPAGRQGYEVILLEKVGDGGTRFYTSLKPGGKLGFAERLMGSFIAYAVDIRHARSFPVSGQFNTSDRGRKVTLSVDVHYHVTDARIVAMETVDPLGELYTKVIAALNRELHRYAESKITSSLIEEIIEGIGLIPHLGLVIEGADVQSFIDDTRATQHIVTKEDALHNTEIQDIMQRASINSKTLEFDAELERKSKLHSSINLGDMNVFMHEHPELIPQIMAALSEKELKLLDAQVNVVQASIAEYIEQQKSINGEINPREIAQILRDSVGSKKTLTFGESTNPPLIEWGEVIDAETSPATEKPTRAKPAKKEKSEKPKAKDDPHINFGE